MRHVLREAIEDQFGARQKIGRTLHALMFKPGLLSSEYFEGRIERYITPFKLYLLTSVIFFLLVGTFTMRNVDVEIDQGLAAARDSIAAQRARTDTTRTDSAGLRVSTSRRDSSGLRVGVSVDDTTDWLRDITIRTGSERLDSMAIKRIRKVGANGPGEAARTLIRAGLQQAPRVMFVLLPIFSLLLFAFFWGRRRYYVEHFVFALHFHAFAYILLLLMVITPDQLGVLGVPMLIWMLLYGLIAMKRFYRQSYPVLIVKYIVLSMAYMMILGAGVVLSLLLVLATV